MQLLGIDDKNLTNKRRLYKETVDKNTGKKYIVAHFVDKDTLAVNKTIPIEFKNLDERKCVITTNKIAYYCSFKGT